ncbi:MAG TPA: methyltransferase [Candidatus Binatia bacterium]
MMNNKVPALNAGRIFTASEPEVGARYKLNDIFCQAWLSHAITAVVLHGIPEIVGKKAISADEIARAKNLEAGTVYRVMRALAANGIFIEAEGRVFQHSEVSRLLRRDHPNSWAGMAKMWNHPSCLQSWMHYPECLTDGRSGVEHAFGKTLYEHLGEDSAATQAFSDAMISNSQHVSKAIAREFPFEKYKTVIDLGGGVGTLLIAILAAHPYLRGAIYEIADLRDAANEYVHRAGFSDRAEIVVGSFIESVPEEYDLYLVKNSLWNWDDDNCSAILRNVRTAIASNTYGRFVIVEYVIADENASWTTLYDLQILNLPGGRARTINEYSDLLHDAGFEIELIQHVEDQTLVVAKPI